MQWAQQLKMKLNPYKQRNKKNSMEQSPSWEANRSSASREILRILWNPKIHYCVHKSLTLNIIYNKPTRCNSGSIVFIIIIIIIINNIYPYSCVSTGHQDSYREWRYHMLLVYNYVLLKMCAWCSKHVEEGIILRINNSQCIKLVINV